MRADQLIQRLAREGAARALRVCLSLEAGDSVAVFFDEDTEAAADAFLEAARDGGLNILERRVLRAAQHECDGRLTRDDQAALDTARGVVVCVSAGRDGLVYRRALVKAAVDLGRYVGLLPGATLSVLAGGVNIDYDKVRARCEDLALAMLKGQQAVLTTYSVGESVTATPYELAMDLGGMSRSPITSSGIIPRGTWGNLPGGETFIAPIEGRASGTFVLNGAFKGRILDPSRPILLSFDRGVLVDMTGPPEDVVQLTNVLGGCPGTSEPLELAELGIGVNEGIPALTGNSLIDEKKAGTIHIALGDNSIYGGLLNSSLHEDLVAVNPSLSIDGKTVVERGAFVLNAADWRESASDVRALGQRLPPDFLIRRISPHHAALDASCRLRLSRQVGAHRQCSYAVGSDEFGIDIAQIYALLPPMPEEIWFSLVERNWADTGPWREGAFLRGLLALLERHEIVRLDVCDEE